MGLDLSLTFQSTLFQGLICRTLSAPSFPPSLAALSIQLVLLLVSRSSTVFVLWASTSSMKRCASHFTSQHFISFRSIFCSGFGCLDLRAWPSFTLFLELLSWSFHHSGKITLMFSSIVVLLTISDVCFWSSRQEASHRLMFLHVVMFFISVILVTGLFSINSAKTPTLTSSDIFSSILIKALITRYRCW